MKQDISILCDDVEITTERYLMNSTIYHLRVKAIKVDIDELLDSLNFEDVMNYYGGVKVCEWCEANR